jgi:hypothetical protein
MAGFPGSMSAATQAISQNIASIRSNLEFLDQKITLQLAVHLHNGAGRIREKS